MLLSVIIPCYNSAHLIIEYFNHIAESVNLNSVEFVVVDDCSADDSYSTLEKYAVLSPCRIVIGSTSTNSGPGTARNIGICLSRGKYITFLDADDRLSISFYEKMDSLLSQEVDLIVFDYYIVKGIKKKRGFQFFSNNHKVDSISEVGVFVAGGPLGKVYRSEIIKNHQITFLNQKRGEDIPFTKVACSYCKSYIYFDEPFYEYVQSEDSIMHDNSLIDPQNGINAYKYIESRLNKTIDVDVLDAIYIKQRLYGGGKAYLKTMSKNQWKSYISDLLKGRPDLLKNKYFHRFSFSTKVLVRLICRKQYTLAKILLFVFRV